MTNPHFDEVVGNLTPKVNGLKIYLDGQIVYFETKINDEIQYTLEQREKNLKIGECLGEFYATEVQQTADKKIEKLTQFSNYLMIKSIVKELKVVKIEHGDEITCKQLNDHIHSLESNQDWLPDKVSVVEELKDIIREEIYNLVIDEYRLPDEDYDELPKEIGDNLPEIIDALYNIVCNVENK